MFGSVTCFFFLLHPLSRFLIIISPDVCHLLVLLLILCSLVGKSVGHCALNVSVLCACVCSPQVSGSRFLLPHHQIVFVNKSVCFVRYLSSGSICLHTGFQKQPETMTEPTMAVGAGVYFFIGTLSAHGDVKFASP